jgi:hypothetical protein
MSIGRPKPQVMGAIYDERGRLWEIIEPQGCYMITFRGQAVAVRYTIHLPSCTQFKYKKMMVNNEGNARLEVKRMNELFKTDDFDYVEVEY